MKISQLHHAARRLLVGVVGLCAVSWNVTATAADRPPNVVVVLADDMGFADLGCQGSEIATPTLDRLAAGGLRFTSFYNTARCWPTRSALMTGLYPHQADMAMNFGPEAPPAYSGSIPRSARMIPELIAPRGYRSYHVGKWHLNDRGGRPNSTWPTGRGFDHSYAIMDHNNYFTPKRLFLDDKPVERPAGDYYLTDDLSDHAVGFLREHAREHAEQPFFLYLAYTAPHFPLHACAEDVAKYRGKYRMGWDELRAQRHRKMTERGIINCGLSPRDPDAKAWNSLTEAERDQWDARMATYAAMIDRLDQGVTRVVKQIETMGVFDDTLILFLSDNGSSAEYIVRGDGDQPGAAPGSKESFKCLEVGWANAANVPFRMHKIWVHEGGISTPLIAHWPNGIKAKGALTRELGHVVDIMPTILEVAGATYPDTFEGERTLTRPGRSFAGAFNGKPLAPRDFLFWEHQGNKAIRQGDWKLVAQFGGPWELYHISDDRIESNDQAGRQPDRVKALEALWTAYAKQTGVVDWASLPQSKSRPNTEYRMK